MGCCNCDCSLCGVLGNNLRTFKVVELYVCSHQGCSSSFLTLAGVEEHKLTKHGQDQFKNSAVVRKKKGIRNIASAVSSGNGSVSLQGCQITLPRVDLVIGANLPSTYSSEAMYDGGQAKQANANYNADYQHSVTVKESDHNSSEHAEVGTSRLESLPSLSVTRMTETALSACTSREYMDNTATDQASKGEEIDLDIVMSNSSTGAGERLLSSLLNSPTNLVHEVNVTNTDIVENNGVNEDSLTIPNISTTSQLSSLSECDLDDDPMDEDNLNVPDIESDHENTHHDEKGRTKSKKQKIEVVADSFRCVTRFCTFSSNNYEQLTLHEKEEHFLWAHEACSANIFKASDLLAEAESKWSCTKCEQKQFSRHEDATLHVITDHDLGGLDIAKCSDCSFTGKHPDILIKHYKVDHCVLKKKTIVRQKRKYKSEAEITEILGKSRLQADEQRNHRIFRCKICGTSRRYGFFSEERLKRHMHKVHNAMGGNWSSTRQLCGICGKSFVDLSTHIKLYHPDQYLQSKDVKQLPPKFFCDKCPFTTSKKAFLANHQKLHEAKIVCSLCGKSYFKHKTKFHMETYHSKLKCTKCEEVLEGHTALSLHMRAKHTDFCEPCGYPFNNRNEHKCPAVCGSEKPKQDEILLGKKVKMFKSHILLMPDKCYLCLECGFRSAEKPMVRHDSTMHKHIPCTHCQAVCLGRAKLVEHMRICHPLVCIFCGTMDNGDMQHSCAQVISGDQSFFQHIPVKYRPKFCRICYQEVWYGGGYRTHLANKHGVKVEALKAKPKGSQKVVNQSILKRQTAFDTVTEAT